MIKVNVEINSKSWHKKIKNPKKYFFKKLKKISQIDLPNKNQSGLIESQKILNGIKEISIINFDHNDVIRHPLVTKIVEAYQKNTNDKG